MSGKVIYVDFNEHRGLRKMIKKTKDFFKRKEKERLIRKKNKVRMASRKKSNKQVKYN